jgi:hypothetical protein
MYVQGPLKKKHGGAKCKEHPGYIPIQSSIFWSFGDLLSWFTSFILHINIMCIMLNYKPSPEPGSWIVINLLHGSSHCPKCSNDIKWSIGQHLKALHPNNEHIKKNQCIYAHILYMYAPKMPLDRHPTINFSTGRRREMKTLYWHITPILMTGHEKLGFNLKGFQYSHLIELRN